MMVSVSSGWVWVVRMDLDGLDAPMFVDFDLIKRGEGEGDEWFGEFK